MSGLASRTARSEASQLPLEIGNQDFDLACRPCGGPDRANRCGKRPGAEVGEVIPVHRRHDDVGEGQRLDRLRQLLRLFRVERDRRPVRDVAVAAGARADVPHDHERRGAVMPALADVGAVRFLAHRVQLEAAHQLAQPKVIRRTRRSHLEPLRLGLPSERHVFDPTATNELERSDSGHRFLTMAFGAIGIPKWRSPVVARRPAARRPGIP